MSNPCKLDDTTQNKVAYAIGYEKGYDEAIDKFAEKLADGIEGFEVDFPNCKNVSVCTLDEVIEKIFEIAEALKGGE